MTVEEAYKPEIEEVHKFKVTDPSTGETWHFLSHDAAEEQVIMIRLRNALVSSVSAHDLVKDLVPEDFVEVLEVAREMLGREDCGMETDD